jgi:hypothetical protein
MVDGQLVEARALGLGKRIEFSGAAGRYYALRH